MHTRVKILVVQSFEAATKNINFEVRSLESCRKKKSEILCIKKVCYKSVVLHFLYIIQIREVNLGK